MTRKTKSDDDDNDDGHQVYGYDIGTISQVIEFTPAEPIVNRPIGFVHFPDNHVAKPKAKRRKR